MTLRGICNALFLLAVVAFLPLAGFAADSADSGEFAYFPIRGAAQGFKWHKKLTDEQRKDEIEKGFSAVKWALGASPSPLFRFPALQHPPTMVTYLGERNISMWSCDLDSFDFKSRTAQKIVDTVMSKLEKNGKGIILMHDFQKHTAEALPEIMKRLKAGGYKVVQVKAKAPMQTIAKYDEELVKDVKLPTVSSRPVNSVVQTISE